MNRTEVAARIQELRSRIDAEGERLALLTLEQKRQFLAGVVLDEKSSMRDRLRALEIDAKLAGEFTEKLDLKGAVPQMVIIPEDLTALQERRRAAILRAQSAED